LLFVEKPKLCLGLLVEVKKNLSEDQIHHSACVLVGTTKQFRTLLFWVITQQVVVIYYLHFGQSVSPIFCVQEDR